MKHLFLIPIMALLMATTLKADTKIHFPPGFSVDLFGAYAVPEPGGFDHVLQNTLRHGKFGVGVGGQYFFNTYFGVGADTVVNEVDDTHGTFIDHTSLSSIARVPLGRFAPYGLAGVTRNWDIDHWSLHTAVGLEARLHKNAGVFTEARYLFERHGDGLQLRAGLRFNL